MVGPPAITLRPLERTDWRQVAEAYEDAVKSLAAPHYSPQQIQAWAHYPDRNGGFTDALAQGFGLVGTTTDRPGSVEAFALLHPDDRLALLYCRARSSRRGLASQLVLALEERARSMGQTRLRTEASQLSRPLLERLGWTVEEEERILFAGESFLRWRMSRTLS
ncbi:MAG: GNAT family N-acetyltransferase [Cyanobium sp.]